MARFSLLFMIAAIAMAGASGVLADGANASAVDLNDLDENGKVIEMINSVVGDEDFEDDDHEVEKRELMRRGKHHHKHSRKNKQHFTIGPDANDELWAKDIKITWYASNDLKNPQCGNGGGSWQPENSSHIGAVVKGWSNGPQCGEFIKLCNAEAGNKCVKVRVIDKCAGCKQGHVDLTKSAFKKLAPSGTLDEGVVEGLKMYKTYKPNPWDLALFGPKLLDVLGQ